MMVSPELMSASSAPNASPLKNCDPNWDQEIVMQNFGAAGDPGACGAEAGSQALSIVAEVAAERIGLLHELGTRHDFQHVPEVFLVLHVGGLLALHDDHRPHEL